MPALEYFLVAESYAIDRDTSAISIFNVFSTLTGNAAPAAPYVIPKLVAIACWVSTREEIDSAAESHVEIAITTPGGSRVPYRGGFTPTAKFQHLVLDLTEGFRVERSGEMTIELLLNNNHIANHTIEIDLTEA